jgi:hypothetical protein
MSVPGSGNDFVYVKVWSGSSAVATNDVFSYTMWISSTSPAIIAGVDWVCSDGTTFRSKAMLDAQGLSCHPNTDLSGVAKDTWYSRSFTIPSSLNGKTVSYCTVVLEGDSVGTYTAYIRNIKQTGGVSTTYFSSSLNVSPPVQLANNGYANVSVSVVPTYDQNGVTRYSALQSVSGVGILGSSVINWQATTPAGTLLQMKYVIDGATSWACTNNAPLPYLPAGMNLSGLSIQILEEFSLTGSSPEVCAVLEAVSVQINPSYTATKTDVLYEVVNGGDWAGTGTLTNTANINNNDLTLNSYIRTWDDANISSQTVFGSNLPSQAVVNKQLQLATVQGTDVRSKFVFAGNWQNFTAEVDITVLTGNVGQGIVYRTTNWGNSNDSYAYSITISTTAIILGKGTNSTGAGAFTSLQNVGITLTAGQTYHLQIVINGNSHIANIDGVQYINHSDSTYTATGAIGLRFYNNTAGAEGSLFDNFSVQSALTGTWQSNAQSIASAVNYGGSVVQWRDVSVASTPGNILVQTSIDGGSTFQTATLGGAIANLTAAQSLSGISVIVKITLSAGAGVDLPGVDSLVVRVFGQYSASGQRIAEGLDLNGVGVC